MQKANKGQGHFFQEAIATFGEDAFKWEQIDTAKCVNELASKEKEYILKNKSLQQSYNMDCGGGMTKEVYQYNLDGSHCHTYQDLDSAATALNATTKKISKTCLSVNQLLDGYYWSYFLEDKFTPRRDKRRKEVVQLDLYGNIVGGFKSIAEASRQTGIGKSPIAKTCRGEQEQTGGYFWKYIN